MLPTLWQQFVEGPLLFQHNTVCVHKAWSIQKWFVEISVEELDWPAQSPELNPPDVNKESYIVLLKSPNFNKATLFS